VIVQAVLLSFFLGFYFLNAFQSDTSNRVYMFLGTNMFWALLRAHFNPRIAARARNMFMPVNINCLVLVIDF